MKKFLAALLALLIAIPINAASLSGTSFGSVTVGGGTGTGSFSSSRVAGRFDCTGWGSAVYTATESVQPEIVVDWGEQVWCWSSNAQVDGVLVNGSPTTWDPSFFTMWDWQDTSLGTSTIGAFPFDLRYGYGIASSHAFALPAGTVYSDTCSDGIAGKKFTLRPTFSTIRSSAREADDNASAIICVRDPSVVYAGTLTVCYYDASGIGSDCPPGAADGGNVAASAGAALQSCNTTAKRLLFKAGKEYTLTTTDLRLSQKKCIVSTYGTPAVTRFKSTSTSGSAAIFTVNQLGLCAGYTIAGPDPAHPFEIAGTGTAPRIGGAAGTAAGQGCLNFVNMRNSAAAGEGLAGVWVNDHPGNRRIQKIGFANVNYTAPNQQAKQTPVVYVKLAYFAWLGGSVTNIRGNGAEHNMRVANWKVAVIDAARLEDPQDGVSCGGCQGAKEIMTVRCPATDTCDTLSITRNGMRQTSRGIVALQLGTSGSGCVTGCPGIRQFDWDVVGNLGFYDSNTSGGSPGAFFQIKQNGDATTSEIQRGRLFMNAYNGDVYTGPLLTNSSSGTSDLSAAGNLSYTSVTTSARNHIVTGLGSLLDFDQNNACWENGAASTCTAISGGTPSSTDTSLQNVPDPFDGTSGLPGDRESTRWVDLLVTANSPLCGPSHTIPPWTKDILGTFIAPVGVTYCAGPVAP